MKGDKNEGCVKSGESFGGVPYEAERSAGWVSFADAHRLYNMGKGDRGVRGLYLRHQNSEAAGHT